LTYLPSQTAVVDFGLAVNRKWKSKEGEDRDETCFIDCRAFGRTAENINKYLSKGRPLFVEGRLTFNQWTAQDGTKRSKHRVTVENFQFLGRAAEDTRASGNQGIREPEPERQSGDNLDAPQDDIPF
jgi:single-strand DNA-binding protein